MRKINTSDVFKMARIFKKANLKEPLQNILIKSKEEDAKEEKIGIEVAFTVLEACAEQKVEEDMYKFLSGVFEIKPEEAEKMPLDSLIENLKEMAKVNDLSTFFKLAGNLNS